MTRRPTIPPAPWDGLDLDKLTPIQRRIFDASYALGFMHGLDRGREQADDEAAAHWSGVASYVKRTAGSPRYSELCERRGQPADAARARAQEARLGLREAS